MASAIDIVLNIVGKYKDTLTGLNQGLELVSKGFGFVKDAAGLAFSAVEKGVNLARVGGAFDEQRNQFENLAKSYGQSGQNIIDTIQKVSSNTVTELEATTVATKALAVGLRGQEMETALTYAKKWSEATGESFEGAAERITSALGTGRFGVLKQMGLVIEKGSSLTQATEVMAKALQRFGDTGFNTADKLDSLGVASEDFWRKVGQGINQSKEFQDLLGNVADSVFDLVKAFDPKPISVFIDYLIQSGQDLLGTLGEQFPELQKIIQRAFEPPTGTGNNLADAAIDAFFMIKKGAAGLVNDLIDIFQVVNTGDLLSGFVNFTVQSFANVGQALAALAKLGIDAFSSLYDFYADSIDSFVKSSPKIAEILGLDTFDTSSVRKMSADLQEGLGAAAESFKTGFADLWADSEDTFGGMNDQLESMKINIGDIDKEHQAAKDSAAGLFDNYKKAADEAQKIQLPENKPISVEIDEESLNKLDNLTKDVKIDARMKLDGEKNKTDQSSRLGYSEILEALAIILEETLSNKAISTGLPLAVMA